MDMDNEQDEALDLFLGDEDEAKDMEEEEEVPDGFHVEDPFETEPEEGI